MDTVSGATSRRWKKEQERNGDRRKEKVKTVSPTRKVNLRKGKRADKKIVFSRLD